MSEYRTVINHPYPEDGFTDIVCKCTVICIVFFISFFVNLILFWTIWRCSKFHRTTYYFIVNLCVTDIFRTLICLPVTFLTVLWKSEWRLGQSACNLFAFAGTLCSFTVLFAMLSLATDRYLCALHPHFYNSRIKGLQCLSILAFSWGVSFVLAVPPVFGLGTYKYIPLEGRCTFEHRHYSDNDTLGFLLFFLAVLIGLVVLYGKIFIALRTQRRMHPVLDQAARSSNWTFVPGAPNNLRLNGLARAVTNLQGIGQPQNAPHINGRHTAVKKNEHLTRILVILTCFYEISWLPYLIVTIWLVVDPTRGVPNIFVTISTWLTYSQTAIIPTVIFLGHKPLFNAFVRLVKKPSCCKKANTEDKYEDVTT